MTTYPKDFKLWATGLDVKAAWATQQDVLNEAIDCPNCGGLGTMSIFIAKRGPFKDPTVPGIEDDGHYVNGQKKISFHLTNHFAEGMWWAGQVKTSVCPVCEGSGYR